MGQVLYRARLRQGLSQGELVRRSGIPQPNISNIEKGKHDITVSTLLKLCSALGVSPSDLFRTFTPQKPLGFTRSRVEKMARAVLDEAGTLSPEEKKIVSLIRKMVPGLHQGRVSLKDLHDSWYELRQSLSDEELKLLLERVQDQSQRSHERK